MPDTHLDQTKKRGWIYFLMTSFSSVICERCGGELTTFKEGSSYGLRCLVCDWSVVATNIAEIKLDEKMYEVFCCGDYKDKKHVAAISKVSGCNFLESRERLRQGEFLTFSGKAIDVLKVRNNLVGVGLSLVIRPEFIWY